MATDVLVAPESAGEKFVILGGGSVGLEVAEFLYYLGKTVTVIEMLDKICGDLGPLNRINVLERVNRSKINIMVRTKVLELNDEGICLWREEKKEVLPPPDMVVVAMGARPNPYSLQVTDSRVHYIGDCKRVGNAMDAIHDAFHTSIEL